MLEKLQRIGLSEKESHIYLALTKMGEATANKIAKQTSSNRTVTYNILQQLAEKGLVTFVNKENRRVYQISNPKSLLAAIKEKELMANELIKDINKIKPNAESGKKVEVHEGVKAMKALHAEMEKCKELRVLNATGLVFEFMKFRAIHYIRTVSRKKMAKLIAVPSMKKTKMAKYRGLEIKYLPEKAENFATTFIYNNKVAIQILKGNPFIIKIENKEIYDGYKKDFDVLWDRL